MKYAVIYTISKLCFNIFYFISFRIDGEDISVMLWDTAGMSSLLNFLALLNNKQFGLMK